jgi:transcriptional regulator with XRE-family HTH domain
MAYEELLRQIEERLDALGLSERKACLKAALSVDAIRNIRRGYGPRAETLKALAQILEVPSGRLLEALESGGSGAGEAARSDVAPSGWIDQLLDRAEDSTTMLFGTLGDALRILMRRRDLSASGLAKKAGVPAKLINDVLRDRAGYPDEETAASVAGALGVAPRLLAPGQEQIAGLLRVARNAIAADLSSGGDGPPEGYVAVPTLDLRPGMGGGGYADEDLMGPPALFPEHLIVQELRGKPLDFLAVEVEGQSMEPVLMSGDQVLIDRRKLNPSQAGVFSLWDGWGLVVKWVERVHDSDPPKLRVMSENKRFSEYEVLAEEARIIGRVVWFARRM